MTPLTFEDWMERIDWIVKATIGLSVHDLPDWEFHDNWDAGMTPGAAAGALIAENIGDLF